MLKCGRIVLRFNKTGNGFFTVSGKNRTIRYAAVDSIVRFLEQVIMKLINNSTIKTFFASAVLTAGIVVSFLGINTLSYYPSKTIGGFILTAHDYSISFNPEGEETLYYKISPYDDNLYSAPDKWKKVIERKENLTNTFLAGKKDKLIANLLELANRAEVRFHTDGKYKIRYNVETEEDQINIRKSISDLKNIFAFGSSLLFAKSDCVFDSNNRVYTDNCAMDISPAVVPATGGERIEAADISFVAISNPSFSSVIVLPVKSGQKVVINRAYKLIEIVENVPKGTKEIKTTQKIKIYESLGQFLNSKDSL